MKVLLDTNAYKIFLHGNEEIKELIANSEETYLSVIVLGELYAGFIGGTKFKFNNEQLEELISKPYINVINLTQNTSQIYGELQNMLKKKGKPIPSNDIWIAAHAIETGSVLITYDKHFKNIDGLRLWDTI